MPRRNYSSPGWKSGAFAFLLLTAAAAQVRAADPPSGPAIQQDLKAFQQTGRVLMIAAHPDDENTQLITYLARGRRYAMAYLSVTRGDGGQNLLGPEFGDELGLIRTEELLAARRLDSGRQFFTRAIDFGFSKTPDETLRFWDHDAVLSDVVRVIREFRPDVIVTVFSPTQTNTHGHHTASAILAQEAFKICGDPKSYPEQHLDPWQPKRILFNARGGAATVTIDAGGMDPLLNQSFASIAAQSRGQHKSQGLGQGPTVGRGGGGGPAIQGFQLMGGDPATKDIMDGIDTTWARFPNGGDPIAKLTDDALAQFDPKNPSASVPALLEIKKKVAALQPDPVIAEKTRDLDRLIAECLGLTVETTVANAQIVAGESTNLHFSAAISSNIPVKWTAVIRDGTFKDGIFGIPVFQQAVDLHPNTPATHDITEQINGDVSQPYWLRLEPAAGIFRVSDNNLIGRPEDPPVFPTTYLFDVAGQTINLSDEPVQLIPGAPAPQQRRRLEVIAPVSLAFPSEVRLFASGIAKSVDVEITAHRDNADGSLSLALPAGWKVSPESQPFKLAAKNDHAKFTFNVTPASPDAAGEILAKAAIAGQTFSTGWKEINYPHIPFLLLQPAATIKALAADVKTLSKNIGYLPGAGDSVAECLDQMGCTVTQLKGPDLTPDNLKKFDAIVTGVRAFNVRDDLAGAPLQNLFKYVEDGGTVVEQYNRPDQLRNPTLAPYNIHLSTLRVTDETAKVAFLAPDNPVLNTPNKITDADFADWVQERNIYLPDQWAQPFTPILGMADPGETPPNSSLLIANHGKGHFIYTSLVFFRQLPAANPGAYRLFANMISLGKP